MTIVPEFVDRVPSELEEGVIYISTSVNTAVHLCPCGCKTEIVTPIDPSEWNFTYDGETISLHPSVGVWGAKCKSHYWLIKNNIEWSRTYNDREIAAVRTKESLDNQNYYRQMNYPAASYGVSSGINVYPLQATGNLTQKRLKNEESQKSTNGWFRRVLKSLGF